MDVTVFLMTLLALDTKSVYPCWWDFVIQIDGSLIFVIYKYPGKNKAVSDSYFSSAFLFLLFIPLFSSPFHRMLHYFFAWSIPLLTQLRHFQQKFNSLTCSAMKEPQSDWSNSFFVRWWWQNKFDVWQEWQSPWEITSTNFDNNYKMTLTEKALEQQKIHRLELVAPSFLVSGHVRSLSCSISSRRWSRMNSVLVCDC